MAPGSVVCVGTSMAECRSFYLESKQNDFAETPEGVSRLDHDILIVDAANDNEPTNKRLEARARALLNRLVTTLRNL
jgi:siroheme synthase (precorrin-2 oxidase/ferrochelatase)